MRGDIQHSAIEVKPPRSGHRSPEPSLFNRYLEQQTTVQILQNIISHFPGHRQRFLALVEHKLDEFRRRIARADDDCIPDSAVFHQPDDRLSIDIDAPESEPNDGNAIFKDCPIAADHSRLAVSEDTIECVFLEFLHRAHNLLQL
jgi:hypothetical protein